MTHHRRLRSPSLRPLPGGAPSALGAPRHRLVPMACAWLMLGAAGVAGAQAVPAPGAGASAPAPATTAPSTTPSPGPAPAPAAAPEAAPAPAVPASAPTAPASVPATAPRRPAAAPAPTTQLERVEVTGGRSEDAEARRQSTAAKIVVGREEIDKYGDNNLGDVLKRLPGITMSGPPGRGGGPRMRGLGGAYTQILIDGERVPPGFNIETLSPEQVERIEILRAPTAETGARAVAGTINIITRGGFRQPLNDLRVGFTHEAGRLMPGVSWTRNHNDGPFSATWSLNAARFGWQEHNEVETVRTNLADGNRQVVQREVNDSEGSRTGINGNARLQWRLGNGESLVLMPFFVRSQGHWDNHGRYAPYRDGVTVGSEGSGGSTFTQARLNSQLNKRLSESLRLELRAGLGRFQVDADNRSRLFDAAGVTTDEQRTRNDLGETSLSLAGKLSSPLDGSHALVTGWELEGARRTEAPQATDESGATIGDDDGRDLEASTRRVALYVQDEWALNPNWAVHAGLRWEGITTRSRSTDTPVDNRSSVWTPLLHAVWKPDPAGRDQVRMSITRSYRSPNLQSLIARRSLSIGTNSFDNPDRLGNPDLRPELARGIDVAVERYLAGGGVLSANVFARRIKDLIRTVREEVPQGDGSTRWQSQPRNIGDADTRGLELEAKGRLSEWITDGPATDVRASLSVFRSSVDGIGGPDNRLDAQPDYTANVGADHRLKGTPFTVGGSLTWTPAYATQVSGIQRTLTGKRLGADAFVQWSVKPGMVLRVSATNLAALDDIRENGVTLTDAGVASNTRTVATTYTQWQVRLEAKL